MINKYISNILFIFLSHSFFCFPLNFNEAHVITEEIAPGIEYQKYSMHVPALQMYVIKLQSNSYLADLMCAREQREEVSSIAKRSKALIAINGANYRRGGKYNGNRVNLCYKKNELIADPCYWRGSCAWFDNEKKWIIAPMIGVPELQINDVVIPIYGINQPCADGQSIIHTANDRRCMYYNGGDQVVIHNGTIEEIAYGDFLLADNVSMICQLDSANNFTAGMAVDFSYALHTSHETINPDFALGGAGLLLQHGIIITDQLRLDFLQSKPLMHCADEIAADFYLSEQQDFLIDLSHPRTALGIDENDTLYLVVVDGRQDASIGFTLHELALFMNFLGCKDAINLGGGCCSTLYCSGKILNKPSQGIERPVSEALCFFN